MKPDGIYTLNLVFGAYATNRVRGEMRSHAFEFRGGHCVRVLCGRISLDSYVLGEEAAEENSAPTCAVCARRDPRPKKTAEGTNG